MGTVNPDWTFAQASSDAQLFCPPSAEARRLHRWFPELSSPVQGLGAPWTRAMRDFLVAPFTQLTFLSFDLQIFLFDVLHLTAATRIGHFVGMAGVNLVVLALLAKLGGWLAAGLGAGLLVFWYALVARQVGLRLWWFATAALVGALLTSALWLSTLLSASQLLLTLLACGAVITFPHALEPMMPPRAADPHRWVSLREFVLGPPGCRLSSAQTVSRIARMSLYPVIGIVNEVWASPRLLPYNVLRLMMRFGYAPALRAQLDERRDRALASGNPALDYVGIGGGSFLRPPS